LVVKISDPPVEFTINCVFTLLVRPPSKVRVPAPARNRVEVAPSKITAPVILLSPLRFSSAMGPGPLPVFTKVISSETVMSPSSRRRTSTEL